MVQTKVDKAIEDFIVLPVIALIGIYVVGVLVDSMLNVNNQTFVVLFAGIGGVSFLIYYFRRKISEYLLS